MTSAQQLAAAYQSLAQDYQRAAVRFSSPELVQMAKGAAATARHLAMGNTLDHVQLAGNHKLRAIQFGPDAPQSPTDPSLASAHDDLARLHQSLEGGGEPLVLLARIPGFPPVDPSWKPILDRIVAKIDPETWRDYVNAQPITDVPIDSLIGTQITVRGDELSRFVQDPELASKKPGHTNEAGFRDDVPIILEVGGRRFVWDGNHRISAAVIRGEPTIKARVARLPMS